MVYLMKDDGEDIQADKTFWTIEVVEKESQGGWTLFWGWFKDDHDKKQYKHKHDNKDK